MIEENKYKLLTMAFTCGNPTASSTLQPVWSSVSGSLTASHPRYVTFYTGCRFKNASSINCAHWCSTVHVHCVASVYLSTMCQPVSKNIGRRSWRSAVRWYLVVPATRTVCCYTVAAAYVLWLVRQHGTLYQRLCVITHWQRRLSADNSRHSSSAEHIPHKHARDCLIHC